MTWVYSPTSLYLAAPAVSTSELTKSADSERSDTSNGNDTPKPSCSQGSGGGCSTMPLSGTTSRASTGSPIVDSWIASLAASRVKTSPSPGNSEQKSTLSKELEAAFGKNTLELFAKWNPDSSSWKTSQGSLLEGLETFSETWPQCGLMLDGKCFQPQTLEPLTLGSEYSSWRGESIPTPSACDSKGSGRQRLERGANNNLRDWFKIHYGFLYPPVKVVEYLMGWPLDHTALDAQATEWFETKVSRRGKGSKKSQGGNK